MTPPVRMSEGPSASRIDDLGSAHIPVPPKNRAFEGDDVLVPSAISPRGRRLAESGGDAVEHSHRLGARPMAGLGLSTYGRI